MTTYRVGAQGATVFDQHGQVLATLPTGAVVVDGTIETDGSLARRHYALMEPKRRRYADKRLRPAEDKG